jgi:hypothetical protein
MIKDVSNKERYLDVVTAVNFESRPSWLGLNNCPVLKAVE